MSRGACGTGLCLQTSRLASLPALRSPPSQLSPRTASALCRTTLPALQELQLAGAHANGTLPGGGCLLAQLVSGAAGSLRRLSLHGASFSCGLGMLAECTALTWLDLAAAPVSSAGMQHLERLQQLSWLSLARTQVTDAGLVHIATAPLTSLDLR